MDAFKNLPTIAKAGIVAVVALIVVFLAYSTMFKAPAPVKLITTQDYATYTTAQGVLAKAGIPFEEEVKDLNYTLTVQQDEQVKASSALAAVGIRDYSGLYKAKKCGAAPGVMANADAKERANRCDDEEAVQSRLLKKGAIGADVTVSSEENPNAMSTEKVKNVSVQLYLPEVRKQNFNAADWASSISKEVGTPVSRIYMNDENGVTLFDGSRAAAKTGGATGATATAGTPSLGCEDVANATEISTKQTAVSNCEKSKLAADLDALVGGPEKYVLSVNAIINASNKSVSTSRVTPGPVTSKSTQNGDGMSNEDTSSAPGSQTTNASTPAGGIQALNMTIVLDPATSADTQAAVKATLAAVASTAPASRTPQIRLATLHPEAAAGAVNPAKAAAEEEAAATETAATTPTAAAGSKFPMPMIVLMVVLVVALVATILVLLQRSAKAAAERERYATEFANQQQVFNTFVQQDPQAMARDLESMFGAAPSRN